MLKRRSPRKTLRYSLVTAAALGGMTLAAGNAEAKPDIVRKGGQWGVMLGGSACVPGKAKCSREEVSIDGKTRPSFGLGAELGYRFNKYVFLGAHYNFGLFDMDYEVTDGSSQYKRGYQNSIYGMVRPTLPAWRFDFGLGVGPGFSRQTFVRENGDKDYSQGFSFIISPSIDIWVSRRIFLGAKFDLLLNGHAKTCHKTGNTTNCVDTVARDLAPVHQMIFGLHLGGTFL
jgi:hypothetical protein